ncbi:MAG: TIGR04452 family lipoprotein [Leptospiraceae bacterium]|nr:TIGR04452 family lipoprotein [Leptospiraceae bacterium]
MKNLSILIILLGLVNCPLLNKITLKTNRITGTEAKSILRERLASFYIKDISDSNPSALAGDFLLPTLAGIEDAGVYKRRDVENCAQRIYLVGIAIDQPSITANRGKKANEPKLPGDPNARFLPPLLCKIDKVDDWIDLE